MASFTRSRAGKRRQAPAGTSAPSQTGGAVASNKQARLRMEQSHASHYRVALVDISNRRQERTAGGQQQQKDASSGSKDGGEHSTLVKEETTYTHKVVTRSHSRPNASKEKSGGASAVEEERAQVAAPQAVNGRPSRSVQSRSTSRSQSQTTGSRSSSRTSERSLWEAQNDGDDDDGGYVAHDDDEEDEEDDYEPEEEDEEDEDEDGIYELEDDTADEAQRATQPPVLAKTVAATATEGASSQILMASVSAPASSSSTSTSIASASSHSSLVASYVAPQLSPEEVAAMVDKWEKSTLTSSSSSSSSPSSSPASYDYSASILAHLLHSECVSQPSPSYMDSVQGDLSFPMRSILMDWLVEVAVEYTLQSQTLFLCIAYTDRFLSVIPVDRSRLQLVGITCLLIAAKYWEIDPPSIDDFVYISDNTYNRQQIIDMERAVLTCLRFQLSVPTAWEFGRRLAVVCSLAPVESCLMDFLMEAFAQDAAFLQHRPSVVAAACAYLALSTVRRSSGQQQQQEVMALVRAGSGYDYPQLKDAVHSLWFLHIRLVTDPNRTIAAGSTGLKAVKDKYSRSRAMAVSKIKPRASIAEIR